MTDKEISRLDPYEGVPTVYDRKEISMVAYEVDDEPAQVGAHNIEGQAYVRVKVNEPFVWPCVEYMRACCKTIYKSRQLMANGLPISPEVNLEIINATNR